MLWSLSLSLSLSLAALRHALRTGTDVGLIVLDLDHFKTVNDTYGHEDGNHILTAVGHRLADDGNGSAGHRVGGKARPVVFGALERDKHLARRNHARVVRGAWRSSSPTR